MPSQETRKALRQMSRARHSLNAGMSALMGAGPEWEGLAEEIRQVSDKLQSLLQRAREKTGRDEERRLRAMFNATFGEGDGVYIRGAPVAVDDVLETYVETGTTVSRAMPVYCVVLKVGRKRLQVQWENGDGPTWKDPAFFTAKCTDPEITREVILKVQERLRRPIPASEIIEESTNG
jgi:hypothetical protein